MGGGDFRSALMRAPWWVLALYSGAIFAVSMFVFGLLEDRSVLSSAVGALVQGLFFGLVMSQISRRLRSQYLSAMGEIADSKQGDVRRALMRGPIPEDPEVRRATLAVIAYRLEVSQRMRWWAPAMWLAFIALGLWLAVSDSPWWLLAAALFGGFFMMQLWTPGRLRSRQSLIKSYPTPPA